MATVGAAPGRRPAVAAALTVLLPGLGDWYLGRRRRAVVYLALSFVLLAAIIAVLSLDAARLLELAVQPRALWALLAVNVAVGLFRIFTVADAYRAGIGSRQTHRRIVGTLVAVSLVAVTAAPHVIAGAYTVEAIDLLMTLFEEDPVAAASDEILFTSPSPIIEVVPPAYAVRPPVVWRPYVDPKPSGRFPLQDIQHHPPVYTEGLDAELITILLAGGDAGPGRSGLRTDVMMVASLDLVRGTASIFGIPRHIRGVPLHELLRTSPFLAEHYDPECQCFLGKTNAIHPFATWDGGLFPKEKDRGMKALEVSMEQLLGIPIDYYMLVDFAGFVDVVDALGGVTVNVRTHIVAEVSPHEEGAEWISVDIPPGRHHLSGTEALAYVRERKVTSDYGRMERQRCMLEAIAAEATPSTMIRRFPSLASAVKRSASTNIPLGVLPDLVSAAAALDFDDIVTMGFDPPYYVYFDEERQLHMFDVDRVRRTVRSVLSGNPPPSQEAGGSEC